MSNEPLIMVDDMIEDMSTERLLVATARALKERGIGYEWNHLGGLDIDVEPEDLADDAMFLDELETQMKRMCVDDIMREFENKGLIVGTVDEDGEIGWTLSKDGEAYVGSN